MTGANMDGRDETIEKGIIGLWTHLKGLSERLVERCDIDPERMRYALSDRKKLAIEIKTVNPHWSNRRIAKLLNCDHQTINNDLKDWAGENSPENGGNSPPIPRTDKKAIAEAYKEDRKGGIEESRNRRLENIAEISKGNEELGVDTRYPIIYADPPWQYENPPMGGGLPGLLGPRDARAGELLIALSRSRN